MDLDLACQCGSVGARIADLRPEIGTHLVCYCDDCQAFARHLGHAERVFDPKGGTGIFQITPDRIEITKGAEHLACLKLKPKGILRWYASCCRTPFADTGAGPGLPFVGVLTSTVSGPDLAWAFGPVVARVQTKFALAPVDEPGTGLVPALRVLWRFAMRAGWSRISGAYRTTPFFDLASNGAPIAAPSALPEDERMAAYSA
jgi:hypothetical protein